MTIAITALALAYLAGHLRGRMQGPKERRPGWFRGQERDDD